MNVCIIGDLLLVNMRTHQTENSNLTWFISAMNEKYSNQNATLSHLTLNNSTLELARTTSTHTIQVQILLKNILEFDICRFYSFHSTGL